MRNDDEFVLQDPRAIKALAHPLRMQILGSLRVDGPATSSMLARRLGTDTGRVSFHLRNLGKHGFAKDAPELGKGRERWWRATQVSTQWNTAEAGGAVGDLEQAALQVWSQLLRDYLSNKDKWQPEWVEAAFYGDFPIRMNPGQLQEFTRRVEDLISEYKEQEVSADADAETVIVLFHAFPFRSSST